LLPQKKQADIKVKNQPNKRESILLSYGYLSYKNGFEEDVILGEEKIFLVEV